MSIVLGYLLSCIFGDIVIRHVNKKLWEKSPHKDESNELRAPRYLSMWLGILERFFYTSAICVNAPGGIAAWLAFKALMRWKSDETNPVHASGISIYQIGTLLSVCFGVIGGLIARGSYKL